MGTWDVDIWADDVAQDLRLDLKDAYAFNDDETALSEIFRVNKDMIADETDDDYSVFFYALADWLWDKGRLPEDIKQKVLGMLERKEGMERFYETENKSLIQQRLKVLEDLKKKLKTEQPKRMKIRSNTGKMRYNIGDVVAFKVVKEQVNAYHYVRHVNVEYNAEFVFIDGKIQKNPYIVDFYNKVIVYLCVGAQEQKWSSTIKNVPKERESLLMQYDYCKNHYPTIEELRKCGYSPRILWGKGAYRRLPNDERIGEKWCNTFLDINYIRNQDAVGGYKYLYNSEGLIAPGLYKKGGRYQVFERNILGNDLGEVERFLNRKKSPLERDEIIDLGFTGLSNYSDYNLWKTVRGEKK